MILFLTYGVFFGWMFTQLSERPAAYLVEIGLRPSFTPLLIGLVFSLVRPRALLYMAAAVSALLIVVLFTNVAAKARREGLP